MRRLFGITIIMAMIWLYGCSHVILKDILKEVDTEITFVELQREPQAYREKLVLLGGVIVKAVNKKDGTLIEVYQTEMDRRGRPIKVDVSRGRFLAHYNGFLDSEIYRKYRKVTIVGIVKGEKIMRLGEIEYHYPYLLIKDIYLWIEQLLPIYEPYPWSPWDY